MANKKISELTAASALTGAELVELVQGGVNKQTTAQAIADLGTGSVNLPPEEKTTDFNLAVADADKLLILNSGSSITITLDDISGSVGAGEGVQWVFLVKGAGTGLFDDNGETVTNTAGNLNFSDQNNFMYLYYDGDSDIYHLSNGGSGGGSGTVTSVGFTGGLISVADPTTTPALTVAGTSGGIPYFSSASTWASSGALAANALVIGGGAGVAPSTTTTGAGILTWLGTPSWTNFLSAITGTAPYWATTGTTTLTGNVTIAQDSRTLTFTQAAQSSTHTMQTVTQAAHTGGSPVGYLFTGGAHTSLAASTEATDINFNLARTVQFSSGTITTQRAFRIQAPTYASTGGATTITNASTLDVSGPPIVGTSMTLTNSWAASFGGQVRTTGSGTTSGTFGFVVFNNSFSNRMLSVRDDSYSMIGRNDFPAGLFRTSDGITPAQTAVNMTFAANASATSAVPYLGFYGGTDAQTSGSNVRIFLGTLPSMLTFQSTSSGTPTFVYWRMAPTINVNTATTPVTMIEMVPTVTSVTDLRGITQSSTSFVNGWGGVTAPTAVMHIGAVTTARASLCINPGSTTTAPSSPVSGDIWHEGTGNRLMFRQGGTSTEVLATSAVNSVSPTAPNRTITVLLNNTTYYIHAKTTND